MYQRLLPIILLIFFPFSIYSQSSGFTKVLLKTKIGFAAGTNFYVGPSGDGKITFKEGKYTEFKNLTSFYIVNSINRNWDIGLRVANGHFWTLLNHSSSTSLESHFNEIQLIANKQSTPYFLQGTPFDLELLFGVGFANFHSKMYTDIFTNPVLHSSIGYGVPITVYTDGTTIHYPDPKNAFLFSIGAKLNYKLTNKFKLFLESRLNSTTTTGFSGNLFRSSNIPPDSYWSNLLGLEFSFGKYPKPNRRIGCPRF